MKKLEIFLAGFSCRLPESDTPYEFFQNLLQKNDMVTGGSKRWVKIDGIPERFGKVKQDLGYFDRSFFAIHGAQAERMDPQLRLLLEVSYEALVDAGLSLSDIMGSKTGVYIGTCSADAVKAWGSKMESMTGYELTGCAYTMLSNRLSYVYDLQGPSETIDTACSSALVAFHRACTDLESGVCDYAIVGGASILLWPSISYGFNKLKMLSPDGACKAFDQSANGFARSEGIIAIILTNKKNMKHNPYAKILGTGVNSGGWNPSGITVPNGEAQKRLYRGVCQKAGVQPKDIDYVEAHGTGTVVGDGEELAAIYDVYGKENADLFIGSVKSNMGHCEGAAGLAGIVKTLLCFEQEVLAPNLHLVNPNPKLNGMRVMTDALPGWKATKAAVSAFGFGGTNAHVILEKYSDHSLESQTFPNALGITLLAHRTKEGLYELKKALTTSQSTFEIPNRENKQKLPFREVLGLPDDLDITSVASSPDKIYFACSGNGSQWKGMGLSLYREFSSFKNVIDRSGQVAGMDLYAVLSTGFQTACEITTALVAVQIGLIELLRCFGIQNDQIGGFFGHSAGEIVCSYLAGLTDLETTIKIAHTRGWVADQTGDQGAMAVIGLSKELVSEIIKKRGSSVVIACVNSPNNVTISGYKADVTAILDSLDGKEVFCRLLDTLDKAYHSPLFVDYKDILEKKLAEILKGSAVPRTEKWSTSISEYKTDVFDHQYHVNGVLRPVDFVQALANVPQNAIVLEIGPHSILKTLIKENRSDLKYASLMKKEVDDLVSFREGIGQLWKLGVNIKLHHGQSLPVQRLPLEIRSKLVSWNHAELLPVPSEKDFRGGNSENHTVTYNLAQEKDRYLSGHMIAGKCILPATSYLCAMWEAFRKHHNLQLTDHVTYAFDDFEIIQTVQVDKDSSVELTVTHLNNQYEVLFNQDVIARVKIDLMPNKVWEKILYVENGNNTFIDEGSFYRIVGNLGYNYLDEFVVLDRLACDYENNSSSGRLKWNNQNWVTLLDGILQAQLINPRKLAEELRVPTRIRSILLNPQVTYQEIVDSESAFIPIAVQFDLGCARVSGVEVWDMETKELGKESKEKEAKIDRKQEYSIVYFGRNSISDPLINDYIGFLSNYAVHLCTNLIESQGLSQVGHYKRIIESFRKWGTPQAVDQEKLKFYRNHPAGITVRMLEDFYYKNQQEFVRNPLVAINQYPEHDRYYTDELAGSLNDKDALVKLLFVVREHIPNRDLNILEIGTGTGGFTRLIAPHVINDRYVATDITVTSQLTVDSRIEQLNFVYEQFDLNRSDQFHLLNKYDVDLVLASNSLHTGNNVDVILENLFSNLKEGGFIVFYEHQGPTCLALWGMDSRLWEFEDERDHGLWMSQALWFEKLKKIGFEVISYFADERDTATLFFVRKPIQLKLKLVDAPTMDQFDEWKSEILSCNQPTLLVATSPEKSGVIGFARTLNREVEGNNFFSLLADRAVNPAIIQEIERCGLRTNVFQHNRLGTLCAADIEYHRDSTYQNNGFHLDFARKGDFSSYKWVNNSSPRSIPMTVSFSALNFKDVMLASAKISKEAFFGYFKDGHMGMEFSGRDQHGNRYMGITTKAIATHVDVDECAAIPIPSHITDEEAATIPLVYITAYYALYDRANIKPGQSVLIHAGTGGVGQAAIHICLSLGCKIFVTCHPGKNKIIKELFPALEEAFILDSRTSEFEKAIMQHTKGRGVDIVLNSLSDEKLQASLRCVAKGGHFLEIGKYDLMKHSSLDMKFLLPNTTVHGINLDQIIEKKEEAKNIFARVERGMNEGVVKPLPRHVFSHEEVSEAFRFLASGKHIGKVLIEMASMREEQMKLLPLRFSQDERDTGYYLITGGLGGFGLSLLTWLVDRGVRKFLVTSRRGITTGEQQWVLNVLRSRGAEIIVSTKDVSTEQGVNELIESVQGNICAVYHLAMVLADGLLKNMTKEKWESAVQIKAKGAMYLDRATRLPSVKHFMAFSSIVNIFGNVGQANYAFGNSALEEVCRLRAEAGYHALAIQWGVISNVGFVANNSAVRDNLKEYFATITIQEALEFLNDLLVSRIKSYCVYYNAVAVKSSKHRTNQLTAEEVISQMCKVIKVDLHTCNGNDTLKDLGIDSLQLVEIQTILLKALQEVIPLKRISSTTVQELIKLIEIGLSQKNEKQKVIEVSSAPTTTSSIIETLYHDEKSAVVYLFLGFGVDYKTLDLPKPKNMSLKIIGWQEAASTDEIADQISLDVKKNQYTKLTFLTHSAGYHIAKAVAAKQELKIDKFVAVAPAHDTVFLNSLIVENLETVPEDVYAKEYAKVAFYVDKHLPIDRIKKQSILLSKTLQIKYLPPHLVLRPREDALSKPTSESIEVKGNHHIKSFDMDEIYAYIE